MKMLKLAVWAAAGLALTTTQAADDFTIIPVSGTVEQKMLDSGEIVLTVRSNSQLRVTGSGKIDVLLIGGGGGGGSASWDGGGGGGGGGGFVYTQDLELVSRDYDVVVGAGGAVNAAGGNTTAFDLTAYGGGKGGRVGKGGDGASGGGGGTPNYGKTSPTFYAGGQAIYGDQGYPGGMSTNKANDTSWRAVRSGGGGGAGGPGLDGALEKPKGGPGRYCDITGENLAYGGGGGGFVTAYNDPAAGGVGGGGKGGCAKYESPAPGKDKRVLGVAAGRGTDWLGGGGGAGSQATDSYGAAGKGGCGVVIVRYKPRNGGHLYERGQVAVGGETSVRKSGGTFYQFHKFTNDAETATFTLTEDAFVDLLLVGGGGAGGCGGGGGGAGGVSVQSNIFLTAGSYVVSVGAGGKGTNSDVMNNGKESFVSNATVRVSVPGGGAGGYHYSPGKAGASGGGGATGYPYSGPSNNRGGKGIVGLGYDGGSGTNLSKNVTSGWAWNLSGGGGGAGAPGTSGAIFSRSPESFTYGHGGDGVCLDFTGKSVWYAGGGGGGTSKNGSAPNYYCAQGGKGGGGRGGGCKANGSLNPIPYKGTPGEPNTGGGGGGGAGFSDNHVAGSDGGSGIVIIRYAVKPTGMMILVR